jgi:capsular polysaccharide transport system permease protein
MRPHDSVQLIAVAPEDTVVDVPYWPESLSGRVSSLKTKLFIGLVAIPFLFVAIYFTFIAADRYVSEASFIVRSAAYQGHIGLGNASGAAMLMSSQGTGDFEDAVSSFIQSRDMVEQLDKNDDLRGLMSRRESDFLYRFPNVYSRNNREQLYKHFLRMVDVEYDKTSGITTVYATTFRPEDSRKLVDALLHHSEELINRLNARMVKDAEEYAQSVVNRAEAHVVEVGLRLVEFRNSVGSVDPSRESATALDQIARMTTELAEMQASLQQQISLSPSSPAIPPLKERIRTYQEQIDQEKLKVVGANRSLTVKLADFEKLTLERQLAARQLDSALASLTAARQDAQRQHLYLQRITEPNRADEAKYPRYFLSLTVAFLLLYALFMLVHSFLRAIRSNGA